MTKENKAMNNLLTKFQTDTWVTATWEEFQQLIVEPEFQKAKFYYHNGQLRIEIVPLGHDRACDNTIVIFAISLFCGIKNILIKGLTNCDSPVLEVITKSNR